MRLLGFEITRDRIPNIPQADDDLYAATAAESYYEEKLEGSRTIFGRTLARIGLSNAKRHVEQAQIDLASSPDEDFYVDN